MRIAIVNQFYVPDISPTAHLSASLAEGLAGAGHQVTVITGRGGYLGKGEEAADRTSNPRVFRVWTPQLGKKSVLRRCVDYASFYFLAAWRMVRLPAQDVVISLTTPPYIAWTGVIHKWMHRKSRLVLWNMDCYPDVAERAGVLKKGGLLSRAMRAMNRALFRRLDHLVCLDEAMRQLLLSQYGPRGRTVPSSIIPNWERASFFPRPEAGAPEPEWAEARTLGLAGKFVILYLGNTGVGHQFETVVAAARRLRDRGVVFLFVGGGKRWGWLTEARQRENLDNLILRPYVDKDLTRAVMRSAHCALITLSQDMLGVMSPSKLHSNLAMGLPVIYIGPETSNVDEAIKRFGCGVSIREGDVEGLVGYVERALGDKNDFAAHKRAARGAFEAAYCDLRTLPQFEGVIASLVAQRSGAAGAADNRGQAVRS